MIHLSFPLFFLSFSFCYKTNVKGKIFTINSETKVPKKLKLALFYEMHELWWLNINLTLSCKDKISENQMTNYASEKGIKKIKVFKLYVCVKVLTFKIFNQRDMKSSRVFWNIFYILFSCLMVSSMDKINVYV